jgi:membrane protein
MGRMRSAWTFFKETVSKWVADGAPQFAAALSFYTLFSLAPVLLIALALTGAVFGREAAEGHLADELIELLGRQGAELAQRAVQAAARPRPGVAATASGVVLILLGASAVFVQLQTALNAIWEVRPRGGGLLHVVRARFASFAAVLAIGFLLLVSLLGSLVISAVGALLETTVTGMRIMDFVASVLIYAFLFAILFKVLPDARITWKDTWVGALFTAVLFAVGKVLIGIYLQMSGLAGTYGAAGSLAVVLLFVYYSALILFLGAEFTFVYAKRYGSRISAHTRPPRPAPSEVVIEAGKGPRRSAVLVGEEQDVRSGAGEVLLSGLVGFLLGLFLARPPRRTSG